MYTPQTDETTKTYIYSPTVQTRTDAREDQASNRH